MFHQNLLFQKKEGHTIAHPSRLCIIQIQQLFSWKKSKGSQSHLLKSGFLVEMEFFSKCWDPLDLSQEKKHLGLNYTYPGGIREGMPLFLLLKSLFR